MKNKFVLISGLYLISVLMFVIISFFKFNIGGYSFDIQNQDQILFPPSYEHLLGTDQLGRDFLARLIFGARLSLLVAVITSFIAFFIGVSLGTIAGIKEGKTDFMITRIIDLMYSIPDLLVLSLIGLAIGRSSIGILIAIGMISWMDVARLTRAEVLKIKHEQYILSARALGLSEFRIFFKHIFPNILNIILVAITFTMPRAIIAESTLSFLGLGLSPPQCSWGTLASDGWQFINTHLNLILFPSLLIMLTVLSLNIIGDYFTDLNQRKEVHVR